MPEEAPISTVHDQFCTASYYIAELQVAAKEAYKTIADREVAERICEEAFVVAMSIFPLLLSESILCPTV